VYLQKEWLTMTRCRELLLELILGWMNSETKRQWSVLPVRVRWGGVSPLITSERHQLMQTIVAVFARLKSWQKKDKWHQRYHACLIDSLSRANPQDKRMVKDSLLYYGQNLLRDTLVGDAKKQLGRETLVVDLGYWRQRWMGKDKWGIGIFAAHSDYLTVQLRMRLISQFEEMKAPPKEMHQDPRRVLMEEV
jgi:hypothetical protein